MNRFRSRKKSHGELAADGSRRPSMDTDVPAMPSFSFRRKKKVEAEVKPEVDIAAALPPSDDFRTSLLMPNLSARFSMLREADNPSSKIGKANDDSVLFPKRASRLDLFNNNGSRPGLSDIAEVDSLRGSIRPPFAYSRTESYGSDGYGTDGEGSIISRARPGEGNTMFGGRQKIYKIPVGQAGSTRNFGTADEGDLPSGRNMGGKALYESDTLPSAFQIARAEARERERQERGRSTNETSMPRSSKEQDRSDSPPLVRYNKNRETSSSTNSGHSQPRMSTAATSIASQKSVYGAHEVIPGLAHGQPPSSHPTSASSDRPFPKAKKLYGQGLDQHQYDPQSNSLQRMSSLNRSRGGGLARNLTQSRSATNLNDKYHRGGPLWTSHGAARAGSPPRSVTPSRMQDFDLGLGSNSATSHVDSGYGKSPSTSPVTTPNLDPVNPDATLVAALEPNDLGKATASGAFNKPVKQYDEEQYLKRQLQLQEGRASPTPQAGRSFSPAGSGLNDQLSGRSRNNSQASNLSNNFSRTNSIRHPWEHHMEDRLRSVPERGGSPSIRRESGGTPNIANERSFFGGMSGSEMSSQPESESEADPSSPAPDNSAFQRFRPPGPPSHSQTHQANPNDTFSNSNAAPQGEPEPQPSRPSDTLTAQRERTSDGRSYRSETTITQSQQEPLSPVQEKPHTLDADSPTLGPTGVSNDLSGMVKQHLRNESNTSSVYPDDSSRRSRSQPRESIFGHESALNQQEAWDEEKSQEDHGGRSRRVEDDIPPMPQAPLGFAARNMLAQATAHRNNQESAKLKQMMGNDKAQQILGGEAPRSGHLNTDPAQWQEQLRAHHVRGGSTETQMERESLASELEERKRAVRNNLQPFAEGQSRDASPAPSGRRHEAAPTKSMHPFGILKKNSAGPAAGKQQEKPSKAMKMLGIDPNQSPGQDQDQPPTGLFIGREQLPDRAMPPRTQGASGSPRPQDVRQRLDESPPSKHRAMFGSRTLQQPQRPSTHSSKSSSAYSDSSDRRPSSQKGSSAPSSGERTQAEGYGTNGAGVDPATKIDESTRKNDIIASNLALLGVGPSKSHTARSGRSRSNSKNVVSAPGQHPQRVAPPGTPVMMNPGGRPNVKSHPYSNHSSPSIQHQHSDHPIMAPTAGSPQPHHSQSRLPFNRHERDRKRSINKHDISEPTFVSCTSSVDTVNLPPGASLQNGMDEVDSTIGAPPIPVRNSRRKRTHTLLQALSGHKSPSSENTSAFSSALPSPTSPSPMYSQTFSDGHRSFPTHHEEPAPSPAVAESSGMNNVGDESHDANAKGRLQPLQEPTSETISTLPEVDDAGGEAGMEQHVPYQAQQDVPASAVMF